MKNWDSKKFEENQGIFPGSFAPEKENSERDKVLIII